MDGGAAQTGQRHQPQQGQQHLDILLSPVVVYQHIYTIFTYLYKLGLASLKLDLFAVLAPLWRNKLPTDIRAAETQFLHFDNSSVLMYLHDSSKF